MNPSKEQLMERRTQLMEALAEFVATEAALNEQLSRVESRKKTTLEDLLFNTQQINEILQKEAEHPKDDEVKLTK